MHLTKPLLHPIETGLTALGWTVGVVRGTATAAAGAVLGHRDATTSEQTEKPARTVTPPASEPRTQTPGDLPTPADLAERVARTPDVTTPVGTTGAGTAYNPDTTETDLQQPGTEPLMDPATTKAVAKEAEMLQRAADPDKG